MKRSWLWWLWVAIFTMNMVVNVAANNAVWAGIHGFCLGFLLVAF